MPDINAGAMMDKFTGLLSVNNMASLIFSIMILVILCLLGFIIYKKATYWAKAWILEEGPSGTFDAKQDLICKVKDRRSGEITFKLYKSKEFIHEPLTTQRFRFGRKYVCPLIRGQDGFLRPLEVELTYQDEKGVVQPFMKPVDTGLKDHIFHMMLQKTAKYQVASLLERLAPYGVMALCVVVVICSIYLHNKAVA